MKNNTTAHPAHLNRLTARLTGPVVLAATITYLTAYCLLQGANALVVDRTRAPRDRGALSLEQAIVTAVLSAAAIALGVVIVNAVTTHSGNIH